MNFSIATGNGGRRSGTWISPREVLSTWLQCQSIWSTDILSHPRARRGSQCLDARANVVADGGVVKEGHRCRKTLCPTASRPVRVTVV